MKKYFLFLVVSITFLMAGAQQYSSYKGLVMAGYQGWFAAEGDNSHRGWYHYQGKNGFGPENCTIDLWPDMTEYTKTYPSPFFFADGRNAPLFSPYDEETVDLHFKWMKEYGLDGVFMQRFIGEVKRPAGKRHFNQVLQNALKAAKKYNRAICIMYDLSGSKPEDMDLVVQDWLELQSLFALFDSNENPTYLHHNGKPLLAIWGIGFNDKRHYSIQNTDYLVDQISKAGNCALMLGIPYYWRSWGNDTENDPQLHALIQKADIIMPWAVGRYDSKTYKKVASQTLKKDFQWCKQHQIDYVPLVFPGFSWGNMRQNKAIIDQIPRLKGEFLWKQVAGAKAAGAEMLYVAMFDEIDEGTAIFKCATENELPLNGNMRFVGIENELDSDFYLWLVGEAKKWISGSQQYDSKLPERNISN